MIEFLISPHGLAILSVVAIIVAFQFYHYNKNKISRKIFLGVFPSDIAKETSIIKYGNNVDGLETTHRNKIWYVIIKSINKYLSNNKGSVTDFHLIKDIVDRNCDAQEEEIHTQIPVPLYLGLVGTMAGILIGVAFLVFSGDLNNLLTSETDSSADGVEALLGGVALAMISSIIGIVLTTAGTLRVKNEKITVEERKNDFLSWMQAELLPELSNDTASALQKMTQNLSDFNRTFSENNAQFTASIAKIADTSDKQAELITLISQLQDKRITVKNLELLKVLEHWIVNLAYIKDYNDILLANSVKIIECFQEEKKQLEQRKTLLAEAINKSDANSQFALEEFNKNFNSTLQKTQESIESRISEIDVVLNTQQETLKTAFEKQNGALLQSIDEQQKLLQEKLKSTTKFVEELNKIGDKIASITKLEQTMREQNGKIGELIKRIDELANAKATGDFGAIDRRSKLPVWQRVVVYTGVGLCFIYILFEVVTKVLSFF